MIFPDVLYRDSLALLKLGAMRLRHVSTLAGYRSRSPLLVRRFTNAAQWGTHALRRGRADEILKAQGAPAMFAQGWWRSVAAWAYPAARTLSDAVSAEAAIAHSDSSEGEGAAA